VHAATSCKQNHRFKSIFNSCESPVCMDYEYLCLLQKTDQFTSDKAVKVYLLLMDKLSTFNCLYNQFELNRDTVGSYVNTLELEWSILTFEISDAC